MAHPVASPAREEHVAQPFSEDLRLRALERLYRRRKAVDSLIRSLEAYRRVKPIRAMCIPINAERKCS